MKQTYFSKKQFLSLVFSVLCLSAYAQSSLYVYTGGIQSYTVPAGVYSIAITSVGARGGNISSHGGAIGGKGAIMQGNFAVTPGQVLRILVGQQGEDATFTGGGGGGTFVWDNGTNTLLIAAGGGGGAGCSDNTGFGLNGLDASTGVNGINGFTMPNGGGVAGNGGTEPTGGVDYYAAGGAGWFSAGANGINLGFCSSPFPTGGNTPLGGGAGGMYGGTSGLDGNGGYGGGGGAHGRCGAIGGGGGGGYSGGGAGGELTSLPNDFTPGGGGGSYNAGTEQLNSPGSPDVNGKVVICERVEPGVVSGTSVICQGSTTNYSSSGASGGAWSSSNTSVAIVGSLSGTVSGVGAGVATITYSVTNWCGTRYATKEITINPLPAAITGTFSVCEAGWTTALSSTTSGGTWSSSNNSIATVGTAGVVTGVAAGTVNIIYTLPTSCMVQQNVTVNPMPAAITGSDRVCVSSVIVLNTITSGGAWSSSDGATASAGTMGDVTGVSAGAATITYMLPTGCYVTAPVSVTALPAVSGGSDVAICYGNSTSMSATGADVYTWMPADGLSCTNCANPTANPTVTTTYTVTGTTKQTIAYSEAFTNGVTPTTQCNSWQSFRASLNGSYNYVGFTIKGSENTTGISCTDPVIAAAVANALRTGTNYSGSSDGQTWTVSAGGCSSSTCGGLFVELANQGGCTCAPGYSIRPNITNDNWGGIDGNTCGAVSQTMEVEFYIEGCTNMATVTVTVNPLPNVYNVIGGGSYCADGTGVEIGVDTTNGGIRYQLYYGLSTIGSLVDGIEDTISFGLQTGAGSYTVEAIDTMTGCTNWMAGSASVTIIPVVVPSVSIYQSTSDTVCEGTPIAFSTYVINGGSNPTFIWKVNGATAGIDSAEFGHVPGVGTSNVSVIVVSDAVCATPDTVMSDTLTTTIFANGTPTVTLAASPNDTVCEGTVVTINPTSTFGGYGPTYVWVKNAIVVGTSSSYTYTPINGDYIYAVMTSNYMCRDTTTAYSNVVDMMVQAPIVPSVAINATPGVNVGAVADTFTAVVTNGGTSPLYQWYFNGAIVAGATNSTYIRSTVAHNDSVGCKVTRTDACGLSTLNSVVINAKVGVQTFGSSSISLVPNPNTGTFTVKGSLGLLSDEAVTVEVTNMLGQVVYNNKFMTQNGDINAQVQTTNLANGSYILNLRSSNGNNVFHFVVTQ